MARGKKVTLTLEEQLEKIISDIEIAKENIKEMEKQKKELEAQIKMERLTELDELIQSSGKTFEEVKELLSK